MKRRERELAMLEERIRNLVDSPDREVVIARIEEFSRRIKMLFKKAKEVDYETARKPMDI